MKTLFRYPGGKTKLRKQILEAVKAVASENDITDFREPFFGGGAIGLSALKEIPSVTKISINDRNVPLASLWTAVIRYPDELIRAQAPATKCQDNQ